MSDKPQLRIWEPTNEDKIRVGKVIDKCIDDLSELNHVEEKAFALDLLVKGFRNAYHVKGMKVIDKKNDV